MRLEQKKKITFKKRIFGNQKKENNIFQKSSFRCKHVFLKMDPKKTSINCESYFYFWRRRERTANAETAIVFSLFAVWLRRRPQTAAAAAEAEAAAAAAASQARKPQNRRRRRGRGRQQSRQE